MTIPTSRRTKIGGGYSTSQINRRM